MTHLKDQLLAIHLKMLGVMPAVDNQPFLLYEIQTLIKWAKSKQSGFIKSSGYCKSNSRAQTHMCLV